MNLRLAHRQCGACTACCVSLGVDGVPGYGHEGKDAGIACMHIAFGCGIYATRPTACATFECGWLEFALGLSDEERPDRSGMLIAPRDLDLTAKGIRARETGVGAAYVIQILRPDVDMRTAAALAQWLLTNCSPRVGGVAIDATYTGYAMKHQIIMGDASLFDGVLQEHVPEAEARRLLGTSK